MLLTLGVFGLPGSVDVGRGCIGQGEARAPAPT